MDHELLPDRARALLRDTADGSSVTHVGVLVPWANTVMETELPLLGQHHIAWHYARLVPDNQTTALDDSFLAGLVRSIPSALHQLSRLPLSSVAVGCTSAAFSFPDEVRAVVADAAVPVFTAFDALVGALRRMEAARVALLAPYPADITKREADAFEAAGVQVVGTASLERRDDLAHITTEAITHMLTSLDSTTIGAADAVVLSCTAWPTISAARALERQIGCPVMSSNLAVAIYAFGHAVATP